jgi:hypothetical protein
MADELYQEFFLSLCEINDNRLVEAKAGGYLEVLCVGVINNIWGKRFRVKTYANGSTNPLYDMSCNMIQIVQVDVSEDFDSRLARGARVMPEMAIPSHDTYDHDKDRRTQRATEQVKELIELAKNSENETERFRARVFDYSRSIYKNTRQFSKASKIPYNVCLESYNIFKENLKQKLSSCRISG